MNPISRYARLKRTPVKKRRSKARPGRLKDEALEILRRDCWLRDGGNCRKCGIHTSYLLDPIHDRSYHMAHIKVKRMGGDNLENVRTLCGKCHRIEHAYGPSGVKPCPKKEVA